MEYKIVLESFEGPMELLIHLIDEAEIDIYDIPINEITEQYIGYIDRMKELDLEVASDFLLMASTLLEIKSKMLLPKEVDLDKDQFELDDVDPRLELVRRLIEYKKYKEVSKELESFEKLQSKVYYKAKEDLSFFVDEDLELKTMSLDELIEAFEGLLAERAKNDIDLNLNEIQREEYSLDESMEEIRRNLEAEENIKFKDLFQGRSNRREVISFFLSLLELIRMEEIIIYQENSFSEILINKRYREGAE